MSEGGMNSALPGQRASARFFGNTNVTFVGDSAPQKAGQTRKQSCIEVATGTGIGMVGSWLISFASYVSIDSLPVATTVATAGCTVWSLVRGYCVRRHFNRRLQVAR